MLPDDLAAPALSLLASFTWWRGDGALARVALARALRCDPEYRLALLLQQMVELAIRPQAR
jgi:transposase